MTASSMPSIRSMTSLTAVSSRLKFFVAAFCLDTARASTLRNLSRAFKRTSSSEKSSLFASLEALTQSGPSLPSPGPPAFLWTLSVSDTYFEALFFGEVDGTTVDVLGGLHDALREGGVGV